MSKTHPAPIKAALTSALVVLAAVLAAPPVVAHDGEHADPALSSQAPAGAGSDLASQATNPVAALVQLQLQNVIVPESHNSSGYANTFIVQPVIPFHIGDGYFSNLIVRPTIPVAVTTPDPDGRESATTAIGDSTFLFGLTHAQKISDRTGFTWAPLMTTVLPTSTDKRTGGDNLQLGGGALFMAATKGVFTAGDALQLGAYGYNNWDVASDNEDVSTLFAGPIVVYHFAELFAQKGWYLRWTDQLMSWDWEDNAPDGKASIPVGAELGRVFKIGKQPVNVFFGGDYYAAHRGTNPKWEMKLNVTFLFPK